MFYMLTQTEGRKICPCDTGSFFGMFYLYIERTHCICILTGVCQGRAYLKSNLDELH